MGDICQYAYHLACLHDIPGAHPSDHRLIRRQEAIAVADADNGSTRDSAGEMHASRFDREHMPARCGNVDPAMSLPIAVRWGREFASNGG